MIVMKFGGSSVDTTEAIARVAGIVRGQLHLRPVVVVSAMAKTTRKLDEAADRVAAGDLDPPILHDLWDYHWNESHGAVPPEGHPALEAMLESYFAELWQILRQVAEEGEVTARRADQVASYGELLASSILSMALSRDGLEAPWIDCRQVLVTDDQFTRARPIYEETDRRLRDALLPHLQEGRVPVLGGYVGATLDGITTTLGKEGSDFSAAIVGAALGAREIQIWTDVEGLMTADPRVVDLARRVRSLSFGEALELACSGAKKPHWGTLGPARRADVPIRILNSWHSVSEGTILGRRNAAAPGIKSIAWKPGRHRLDVHRVTGDAKGFLEKVFEVCERFRPALQVLDADEETAGLALESADRLAEIRTALEGFARVDVEGGQAVVTLVSEDLATSPDLVRATMDIASPWQPRLVLEGVASPCIRCLVEERDAERIVTELHDRIFPDPPGPEEAVE